MKEQLMSAGIKLCNTAVVHQAFQSALPESSDAHCCWSCTEDHGLQQCTLALTARCRKAQLVFVLLTEASDNHFQKTCLL